MRYLILVACSIQALFFIPVLIGVLADNLGFSESQLGGIAAADLAGFSLACLWVSFQVRRLCWKRLIAISAAAIIVANLSSIWVTEFWGLFGLRVIAGGGAGVAYAIAMIALARDDRATALFGWSMAAQGLIAMVCLASLPHLLAFWGMPVLFVLLALLGLICGLTTINLEPLVPHKNKSTKPTEPSQTILWTGVFVLAGIFSLYLGQGGFTAFIERIGADGGVDSEFIGYSLSASAFAGVIGGVVAGLQSQKLGLRLPLLMAFIGQSLSIWLLLQPNSGPWGYLVVLMLYNFCWVYVVPYHLTWAANVSDRLVALAPALQGGGLAVGAALSGGLLEASTGFGPLYLLILITGFVSLVLVTSSSLFRRAEESLVTGTVE